ncbi:MAG: type III-B CRISPR module RAMP protein Cmr1 [Candidatus Brocadia sp.]|nr:MAG: type III-B CRISPR module RAMP protein Cmr1 [Candidatus Brocadia sp.]
MPMETLTVTLKTVTPLFPGGAEPNERAELRAPSIKGTMRFWYRAMNGEASIEKLYKKEAALFGGSGDGEGRSRIIIRMPSPLNKDDVKNSLWDEIPHKNEVSKKGVSYLVPTDKSAGIFYLLYSMLLPNRERPFIKADSSEFRIILQSLDTNALRQSLASLWCAVYMGGFGARSRRGGGNVMATDVHDVSMLKNFSLNFIPAGENSQEVANWLISNLHAAKGIISGGKSDWISTYSNLSLSRFIICRSCKTTWLESLNEVGKIFKEFRNSHKNDILDTAAFGLPIMHGIRTGNRVTVKGSFNRTDMDRRGSPLIFKIIKVKNSYYWFVLRLSGEFLPEGGVIKANSKTQKPDYQLLDEFWPKLKNRGEEYILSKPQALHDLTEKIKKTVNPEKIILYGSRARGDFHRHSDTDIAVETNGSIEDIKAAGAADIVNYRKIDKRLKDKIDKESVTLYERKG